MDQPKLHEQARRRIERLIADRGIKSVTRIPTERELARELYVSVTTIRTALKALEQVGKIERTPGRGPLCDSPPRSVTRQLFQLRRRDEVRGLPLD